MIDKEKFRVLMISPAKNRDAILEVLAEMSRVIAGTMHQRFVSTDDLRQGVFESLAELVDSVISGKTSPPRDAFAWLWTRGVIAAKHAVRVERRSHTKISAISIDDIIQMRPLEMPAAAVPGHGRKRDTIRVSNIDRRIRKLFELASDSGLSPEESSKILFGIDLMQGLRFEECGKYRRLNLPSIRYTTERRLELG